MEKKTTCCICGKPFKGYGNNPWPIAEKGVCCDKCNLTQVIPARLQQMEDKDNEK